MTVDCCSPCSLQNGCCYREHLFDEQSVCSNDDSNATTTGKYSGISSSDAKAEIHVLLKKMKMVVCMKLRRADSDTVVIASAGANVPGKQFEVHLLQENRQQFGKKPVRFDSS